MKRTFFKPFGSKVSKGLPRSAARYIFIDRDGVINKDPGGWTKYNYVTNIGEFHFIPGAVEALKKLTSAGYKVIVISNQAGVSKGYFTKAQLRTVNDHMLKEVKSSGGDIEESFYCIHKDEDRCSCRKPKAGLLVMAARKHRIKLKNAYFIGDVEGDMIAGRAVGAKTVLVLSGKSSAEDAKRWEARPDYIFKDLLEAVRWLLAKEKRRFERSSRRRVAARENR